MVSLKEEFSKKKQQKKSKHYNFKDDYRSRLIDKEKIIRFEDDYHSGDSFFKQKDFLRAIEKYTSCVVFFKENITESMRSERTDFNEILASCYFSLGLCYMSIKNYNLALENYNNGIKLNPEFSEAYINRGVCYINLKEYELASENFTKVIDDFAVNHVEAYNNRAICYLKLGKNDFALNDYETSKSLEKSQEGSKSLEQSQGDSQKKMVPSKEDYDDLFETSTKQKEELKRQNEKLEQTRVKLQGKEKELEEKNKTLESEIKQKEAAYQELKSSKKIIEEQNSLLKEKELELEDMMSMFAHKFRSPLDAIIYNTTHQNQIKLYTESAQTMRGLLELFSIISTNPTVLKKKLIEDNQGNSNLITVFSKNLNMTLLHLLSASSRERIRQHYFAYAKTQGLCDANTSRKVWREDFFELEQRLQNEWEQSYAQLLNQSATLTERLNWLAQHFFTLKLIGFDHDGIAFEEYSVTESFLTIILNEILVNTFKYYSSETQQSVIMEWAVRDNHQVLICRNPSFGKERTNFKGSQKGHNFLSTLARNIGSQFIKPIPQDNFVVEFSIPNELLINPEVK